MTTAETVAALHAAIGTVRPGVNFGDRVAITYPGLTGVATGTVGAVGWGSEIANVRLDGTGTVVQIPESLLERIHP